MRRARTFFQLVTSGSHGGEDVDHGRVSTAPSRIYINDFSGLGSACLAVAVLRAMEMGAPDILYSYPENAILASRLGLEAAGLRRMMATTPASWRRFDDADWADIADFIRARRIDTVVNFRNPDLAVDPRYRNFQEWCRSTGRELRWYDYYDGDTARLAKRHVYDRMTDLLTRAGVTCAPLRVEWLAGLRRSRKPDRDTPAVGLFVTASTATKQWPVDRWRALAVHLARESPADLAILVGDSPAERLTAAALYDALLIELPGRVRPPVWPGSMDDLLTRIAAFDLLISNDTGAGHLAAACGTPLVSVFLSTNPEVWAPRTARSAYRRSRIGAACPQQRPAQGNCTRHYDSCVAPCGRDLPPEQVAAAALNLLKRPDPSSGVRGE